MTHMAASGRVRATIRVDGSLAEVRALLAQVLQSCTLQLAGLPVVGGAVRVTREAWGGGTDEVGARLDGLRFRAESVCAYVAARAGLPAQVEFEVFAHEPCTLELVLRELPALLAILGDPDFQTAVGWQASEGAAGPC